jgi:hypothetical protein
MCKINQSWQKREARPCTSRVGNRKRVHELHDFSGNSDKKEKQARRLQITRLAFLALLV